MCYSLCKLSSKKNRRSLRLVSIVLGFFLLSCNPWVLQPYPYYDCKGEELPDNVNHQWLHEACKELSGKMGYDTHLVNIPKFTFTNKDPWQCNELLKLDISVKGCHVKYVQMTDDGRLVMPGIYINGNSTNQRCLVKHEFAHYLLDLNNVISTRDAHGGSHHRIMEGIVYSGYICHREWK